MIRRALQRVTQTIKSLAMAEPVTSSSESNAAAKLPGLESLQDLAGVKRAGEPVQDVVLKRQRPSEQKDKEVQPGHQPFKKKKMAMLMMYSGKGYVGMQIQSGGLKTIEHEILTALVKAEVIKEEHATQPGAKISFQRAARTDKGVSAAGQVVSLKMCVDVENAVEKINANLPPQIRVLGIKRGTKGFDSKNSCCARTYSYMLPTFAFTPVEQLVNENFRATPEIVERANQVLSLFKGTKNFHNFTSGKKPNDPSARRYILDFHMKDPFVKEDIEWVIFEVKGQSFMMHQIRKMIGLTIAIVRGLTGMEAVERAWGPDKCDIPKAPGLGLMLDKVHYDHYNRRFGNDGLHEAIDWDQYKEEIENFKHKYIYSTILDTEKQEKSTLMWMSTLHLHHFNKVPEVSDVRGNTPLAQAKYKLVGETREQEAAAAAAATTATTSADVQPPTDSAAPCDIATPDATQIVNTSAATQTVESNTQTDSTDGLAEATSTQDACAHGDGSENGGDSQTLDKQTGTT